MRICKYAPHKVKLIGPELCDRWYSCCLKLAFRREVKMESFVCRPNDLENLTKDPVQFRGNI